MNATTSGRDLSGWGAFWLNHEMGRMGLLTCMPIRARDIVSSVVSA
jgi:hypothetical protein